MMLYGICPYLLENLITNSTVCEGRANDYVCYINYLDYELSNSE